ncbi:MAG: WD40 repeat domain-containing protein [Candidatus Sigynarchaeota archaeon]
MESSRISRPKKMLPEWRVDPKTGRALISTAMQCRDLLAVAGEDGAVRTWDARFRLFKKELRYQKSGITSLAANSTHLFTGSRDGTIIAWAMEDWLPDYKLSGFSCGIQRMACNGNTLLYKTLVFGTTGMVDTRTLQKPSSIWKPSGFAGNTIDFSITSTRMATTTDEGRIHVWDLGTRALLCTLESESAFPTVCMDGQLLAYPDGNRRIAIVDTTSWDVITRLDHDVPADMYCLVLHDKHVAAGFANGSAVIWNRGAWTVAKTHRRREDPVVAIVFMDPDVFVVHEHGLIDIFNTCDWRPAGKLENKTPTIDAQLKSRDKVIARLSRESAALRKRLGTQ